MCVGRGGQQVWNMKQSGGVRLRRESIAGDLLWVLQTHALSVILPLLSIHVLNEADRSQSRVVVQRIQVLKSRTPPSNFRLFYR